MESGGGGFSLHQCGLALIQTSKPAFAILYGWTHKIADTNHLMQSISELQLLAATAFHRSQAVEPVATTARQHVGGD